MRHIAQLDSSKIPRDTEFQFKERAQALVNKWHGMIDKQNGTNGAAQNAISADDSILIDKKDTDTQIDKTKEFAPPLAEVPAESTNEIDVKMDAVTENHVNDTVMGEEEAEDEKTALDDQVMSEA